MEQYKENTEIQIVYDIFFSNANKIHQSGVYLPFLKSIWGLVYPGQNRDAREILRNLIG